MRKLLVVVALVASMFAVGEAVPDADAAECSWCEIAGSLEGGGIIVPDPNSVGYLLTWEGKLTGVAHYMVAGGQPITGTFKAEGVVFDDPGSPVAQKKGWVDFTFTETPLLTGLPATQEWTTEFHVRSFDSGKSWVFSYTDDADSAVGTYATVDRNATTHSVTALRPYRGVFGGHHAPNVV